MKFLGLLVWVPGFSCAPAGDRSALIGGRPLLLLSAGSDASAGRVWFEPWRDADSSYGRLLILHVRRSITWPWSWWVGRLS